MKSTGLLLTAGVIALSALAGTVYMGKTASKVPFNRPELRIGEQAPGPSLPSGSATWSPKRDKDGYTVTSTLPAYDSRVAQFADFPLLLPGHLPEGTKLGSATLIWDPSTEKRVLQIAIQGKYSGLMSLQRIRDRNDEYPDGILIRTETQTNGTVYRNLLSNVDGIAVSMAWNPALSDEAIIQSFQSLKPQPKPAAAKL